MSDDLVKRLRDRRVCSLAQNSCRNDWACEQAADRIEELEAKLVAADPRVKALVDRASDYMRIAEGIGSCGDGGCVVFQQKGQHTNGGCRCIDCLDRGELRRLNRLLMIAQATMKLIIKGEQP